MPPNVVAHIENQEVLSMTTTVRPQRRLSPAGIRHAERYQQLSKTEQRFVKKIMDVLLERNSGRR